MNCMQNKLWNKLNRKKKKMRTDSNQLFSKQVKEFATKQRQLNEEIFQGTANENGSDEENKQTYSHKLSKKEKNEQLQIQIEEQYNYTTDEELMVQLNDQPSNKSQDQQLTKIKQKLNNTENELKQQQDLLAAFQNHVVRLNDDKDKMLTEKKKQADYITKLEKRIKNAVETNDNTKNKFLITC
eukprot:3380_1